jgi:hypothetical protein
MLIDILAGVFVLWFAWSGNQSGALAALYRAGFSGLALIAAKLVAAPTANYLMKGIEWSAPFAYGLMFLIYFLVFALALKFITASLVRTGENVGGDGGLVDQVVGTLIGAGQGALFVYALLAATVLLTHRLGARKPMFAFAFDKSYAARFVMTRNVVNPEPFPHAYTLRVLVGADPNQGFNPEAMGSIARLESVKQTIVGDAAVVTAIESQDWKALRTNTALLGVLCSAEFLQYADDFITPRHAIKAEEPTERFKELKTN